MRCVAVLALLVGSLVLGACGGDEEGGSAPSATSAPPSSTSGPTPAAPVTGPEAAYRAWLGAMAVRDARATCARHAPDFTIALRFEAVLLDRAELGDPCVGFVAVLWEQPGRELEPLGIEVTQETREDALLAVDFTDADVTVAMERRNGSWFVLEESRRNQSPAAGANPPRWLDAWCELRLAMTTSELVALMGPPSGTYTIANGGEPQLYWTQDQYDFRAYLDADPPGGTAVDLVGDYDRLTSRNRGELTCPELR